MDIIGKKNWFFAISLIVIIPGVISLLLWGLNLSIDFAGGSRTILTFPKAVNEQQRQVIQQVYTNQKIEVSSVQPSGNGVIVRTRTITPAQNNAILKQLQKNLGAVQEEDFET